MVPTQGRKQRGLRSAAFCSTTASKVAEEPEEEERWEGYGRMAYGGDSSALMDTITSARPDAPC